jgi:hypothetical protein
MPVVCPGVIQTVRTRRLNLLLLHRSECRMPARHAPPFNRRGIMTDPVRSPVVRNVPLVGNSASSHHVLIHIRIVNHSGVHPHDCGVVREPPIAPLAACESLAHVAVAVIDATVVADIVSPVTLVEPVSAVVPTPPWRSPHCTRVRCGHPGPRNPVVPVLLAPRPVPRRPHPPLLRTRRLLIHRKRRRRCCNSD